MFPFTNAQWVEWIKDHDDEFKGSPLKVGTVCQIWTDVSSSRKLLKQIPHCANTCKKHTNTHTKKQTMI